MNESTTSRPDIEAARLAAPLPKLQPRLAAGERPHGLAPEELVKLHHSLADLLDSDEGVIAQFLAPEPDAATKSVVYDLAYISAAWLGERVLFIDGNNMRFDPKKALDLGRREPILAGHLDLGDVENSLTRVVGLDLYQMTFPSMCGALELAPVLRSMPEFLTRLRESFDLVVIAAPAASEAPMGLLLSRFVDANVLVLAAGRTRAPVANELRDSLLAAGGVVVGAVLTHCRSYVPRSLRRWL
jgi:protein-tyrosine kinase